MPSKVLPQWNAPSRRCAPAGSGAASPPSTRGSGKARAVLEVLQSPAPRLKQVSDPVTLFDATLHALLADLEETMRAGPGSVGIAAPQVNRFFRIAIVDVSSKPDIPQHGCLRLINPVVVQRAGEVKGREGCMSVPDYTGTVVRAQSVRVRCQDGGRRGWG